MHEERFRRLSVLKYASQLPSTFQFFDCTFVTILFRFFDELIINLPVHKRTFVTEFTTRFRLTFLKFGRMPKNKG